jgi:acetolactate synthase I/II/III large subunit
MKQQISQRNGGRVLVDQLIVHGATHAFCVPGESYLAVLDAFHESAIEMTVCRQEGGAAMMAEAHGKLSGKPGICFVTRGPGATNASSGVHVARQDSTPMILFIGQVERGMRGREAFQEIDYRAMFGDLAKWVAEIDDACRIPEIVSRAFYTAVSGRPGPVVIVLPEDVLTDIVMVSDARSYSVPDPVPSQSELKLFEALLAAARRPVVIAGGGRWNQGSVESLVEFSDRFGLPIATSFRRQSLFPSSHPHFIGDVGVAANPQLISAIKDADLVLLLGGRFSELPSQGYTILNIPTPVQRLVHVHPGVEEIGRVYQPDLGLAVSPASFLTGVLPLPPIKPSRDRQAEISAMRASYDSWSSVPTDVPGRFNLGEAIHQLQKRMPARTVIANGAGNYAAWVHRFYRFERFGTQLAPTSGSMGYGLPAGIAAARIDSSRPSVVIAGDGCFLMHGQEFATAIQYGLPILVIVVDNGMYGTIRMHQERDYPGRVVATNLRNPDFAAYACAFGGHGERVERTEDFMPAVERALASGRASIVHCLVDPQAITPNQTLDAIRQHALARVN